MNRIGFVTIGHSDWDDTVWDVISSSPDHEWAFVGYCAALGCEITVDNKNQVTYVDSDKTAKEIAAELSEFIKYEL